MTRWVYGHQMFEIGDCVEALVSATADLDGCVLSVMNFRRRLEPARKWPACIAVVLTTGLRAGKATQSSRTRCSTRTCEDFALAVR